MSAFNDLSYLNNAGLQHLNDRLHNTFRVTSGQSDYANLGNFAASSGYHTNANGDYSYAEGYQTSSIGSFSHSEGLFTNAIGSYSHSEGQNTYSNGEASHAEGYNTRSFGNYSHAEGNKSLANAEFSHAEGGSTTANGLYSHAEGSDTTAFGHSAHAEGATTRSYGVGAHSEGKMTLASGDGAHVEGSSVVSASYSSSKGIISYADGSHAEGRVDGHNSFIKALGLGSHAEGYANLEGTGVNAYGVGSHAEGGSTGAIGDYSHAEGLSTQALGAASHASGYGTIANAPYATVVGKYSNDSQDILFGVGNGNDAENRSSCFEITTDGFIRTGDTKIRFGVDANGNYGYIKPGADTVYPFSLGGGESKVSSFVSYNVNNVLYNKWFNNNNNPYTASNCFTYNIIFNTGILYNPSTDSYIINANPIIDTQSKLTLYIDEITFTNIYGGLAAGYTFTETFYLFVENNRYLLGNVTVLGSNVRNVSFNHLIFNDIPCNNFYNVFFLGAGRARQWNSKVSWYGIMSIY